MAEAVAAGDHELLQQFERVLASYFPEAVRVRIILPTDTDPDSSISPPIGYACLDLARQAESGTERPPLELHLHGSKDAHLDLVRPISYNGDTIASLMVSFTPDTISDWLDELAPESGFVELQQGWEGPLLGRRGDASLKSGDPAHRAMISGSSWQLSYWASDSVGMAEVQKVTFLTTFGVAAAVIVVLLYLYALFVSRTLRRELDSMATFMLESSIGKRFHSYPVRMVEIEEALMKMEPVLKQERSNDDIKEKAELGDGGASNLMFMDFGEITVDEDDGGEKKK
jgi:hypothetical protein